MLLKNVFKEAKLLEPQISEEDDGFLVTLFKSEVELNMSAQIIQFLAQEPLLKSQIAQKLGKDKPTRYLNELMNKLLNEELVEYTIPDKPNSRLQKYRLAKQ